MLLTLVDDPAGDLVALLADGRNIAIGRMGGDSAARLGGLGRPAATT
jgi:hypothetical protein